MQPRIKGLPQSDIEHVLQIANIKAFSYFRSPRFYNRKQSKHSALKPTSPTKRCWALQLSLLTQKWKVLYRMSPWLRLKFPLLPELQGRHCHMPSPSIFLKGWGLLKPIELLSLHTNLLSCWHPRNPLPQEELGSSTTTQLSPKESQIPQEGRNRFTTRLESPRLAASQNAIKISSWQLRKLMAGMQTQSSKQRSQSAVMEESSTTTTDPTYAPLWFLPLGLGHIVLSIQAATWTRYEKQKLTSYHLERREMEAAPAPLFLFFFFLLQEKGTAVAAPLEAADYQCVCRDATTVVEWSLSVRGMRSQAEMIKRLEAEDKRGWDGKEWTARIGKKGERRNEKREICTWKTPQALNSEHEVE